MIKKYRIILILFLIISIGYAVLTSNLNINGTFGFSESKWDVHFENIIVSNGSVEANVPEISSSNDTISFTGSFDKPGDFYEFSVDVVNAGTMDAVLNELVKSSLTEEQAKYINYVVRYYGNREIQVNDILPAGYKERVVVRAEYKYEVEALATLSNIDFSLTMNYVKRNLRETYNNEVWSLFYTGREQVFTAPYDGKYLIETWGAQGGNSNAKYTGGYGAYAVGNVNLDKNSTIFINIGGQGNTCFESNTSCSGGYNGGGNAKSYDNDINPTSAGGGGATHVAIISGLLSSLESNKNSIIMVAAGGGGGHQTNSSNGGYGGSGGGNKGSNPTGLLLDSTKVITRMAFPGTQTAGGCNGANADCGGFGYGGTSAMANHNGAGSGGGAGYYGGSGANIGPGAGGSSYIGNSLLTEKVMYCYNCEESSEESTKTISTTNVSSEPISQYAKIGNGYVRITYLK